MTRHMPSIIRAGVRNEFSINDIGSRRIHGFVSALTNGAWAQSGSPFSKSSSGLTLSVLRSDASQRTITLQFNLENNTKARMYVRNIAFEEKAFLGFGAQLSPPQNVVGIMECHDSSAEFCMRTGNGYQASNTNVYSYVEPGESIAFSFTYQTPNPVRDTDTASFPVSLIALPTKPNGDPAAAGPPQHVNFNFAFMPLNRR
jgi:hypothetical protein